MTGRAPKVEVKFFGTLQTIFQDKERRLELSKAANVHGLLDDLCNAPEHRRELFNAQGQLQADLTILKNGRNIAFLNGLDTELGDGDTVAIFFPVRGG
jgi:molybdopterin synthase sulfur carrier subunit